MANPFLFTEDLGSSQVSNNTTSFNPFLSGGGDMGGSAVSDNPFMSSFSAPAENSYDSSGQGTNPFAFSDTSNATDFFSMGNEGGGIDQNSEINYENIFSSHAPAQPDGLDFFSNANVPSDSSTSKPAHGLEEDFLSTGDSSGYFGQTTNEPEITDENVSSKGPPVPPPSRPPPPRPGPPKETKDLILSVTGAMEATSSHLLDRLQATRTPSPTPMRDLHSPSPTHFGDLLEVDEPMEPLAKTEPQEANLLGDFDFSAPVAEPTVEKRPSVTEATITPITPVRAPSELAQPISPMHSTPASQPVSSLETTPVKPPPPAIPPSRPAPPSVPERPRAPPPIPRPPLPARAPTPEPPLEIKSPQHEPEKRKESGFADMFGDISNANDVTKTSVSSDMFDSVFVDTKPSTEQKDLFSTNDSGDAFALSQPSAESADTIASNAFSSLTDEGPFSQNQTANAFSDPTPVQAFMSSDELNIRNTNEADELDFTMATQPSAADLSFNMFDSVSTSQPAGDQNSVFDSMVATGPTDSAFDSISSAAPSDSAFDAFGTTAPSNAFDSISTARERPAGVTTGDDFDAFTAKFESAGFGDTVVGQPKASSDPFDPFTSAFAGSNTEDLGTGFDGDDNFDSFLSLREPPPVPQGTPARVSRGESAESVDDNEFNIFIKPKQTDDFGGAMDNGPLPALAPPPKSPSQMNAFQDTSPRLNPFDIAQDIPAATTDNIFAQAVTATEDRSLARTDSQETPPTPLFDEDVSQPLEDFPRINYDGPGWEMQLRQPNKKKITGQRFWKKIFIKLVFQGENPVLQLFNSKDDKDPFQELPLQPCYSVSDIAAQQYDQYGKIFTVKLQFIFYKERPGVRPGQVTKAERITNKLSQFAAYAIQGDYQGVKEFGSDLKKLGLPVEHAPQISQLFKIGSINYEDMKQFSMTVEEALFRLPAHRDRALTYKMEEVQITAVDELYVEQNANGGVDKQIARVRLFFLGFLSGMPDVELGVNDLVRQGKEVVGRHDIIPVVTEEWIRLENVEFHSCVQLDEYDRTRTIRFKPPDACYLELMRFRIRPPKNRELPLQLKTTICVTGNKVEIHGDILVPGFTSRKLGQIPCEDVMVRIPIPECWIYQFRVEKHFRYGSVKSAHRRTGKVKGIERFLGAIENMEPSLMEVTSGQAKYEHQHRAIVWRMPRLPKEGQGAYTTHNLVVRLTLTSYDQIPDQLAKYCYLEFTMPATTVSHTTVRSVSIANSDSDTPPEKYVRQLSRHEYRIEIEHTQGEGPGDYIAATVSKPAVIKEEEAPRPAPPPPESDSDSDSG